jgi:hypothetical protein
LTSVDHVWLEMEGSIEHGGSRRIDASYAHDAFCTLDSIGRRGLLLITDRPPDHVPLFDAMEIVISRRVDDRTGITITLLSASLKPAFVSLCDGLLAACHAVAPAALAEKVVTYLVHANSLLEYGDPQILGATALRGLIGELIILGELLTIQPATASIDAWMGPLGSAQDFVFADRFIETKTKTPISNRVVISSVDQLDPVTPLPLTLAVVTISSLQDDLIGATSPNDLVDGIRMKLDEEPLATIEFDRRLRAANYFPRPYYEKMKFRLISMRFYKLSPGFPRLRQSSLPKGVVSASYELDLSECERFETLLEDSWI